MQLEHLEMRWRVLKSRILSIQSIVSIQNDIQIGREKSGLTLQLKEIGISRTHAAVSVNTSMFEESSGPSFYLQDCGSTHGTFINKIRLSEPKKKSVPKPLSHLDRVYIGTTTFEVHIHPVGQDCPCCLLTPENTISLLSEKHPDPIVHGQSEVELESKKRKSYIPPHSRVVFANQTTSNIPVITSKDIQTAEVIPDSNFGHVLLSKMGWSKGSGLGASRQGIVDPVMPPGQLHRQGLGFQVKD